MSARKIASRYAKALFDLTLEREEVDAVKTDLVVIHQSLNVSSELREAMANPFISARGKREVLAIILSKGSLLSKGSPTISRFLDLLALKNRFEVLVDICLVFEEEILKRENKQRATVYSVQKLAESQLTLLAEKLKEKHDSNFILKNEVDSQLLGGLRIKIKDRIYDYSIKGGLNDLFDHLLGKSL